MGPAPKPKMHNVEGPAPVVVVPKRRGRQQIVDGIASETMFFLFFSVTIFTKYFNCTMINYNYLSFSVPVGEEKLSKEIQKQRRHRRREKLVFENDKPKLLARREANSKRAHKYYWKGRETKQQRLEVFNLSCS